MGLVVGLGEVGFEYFFGEELDEVEDEVIISLLLKSSGKSRINGHCNFYLKNYLIFDIIYCKN